MIETYTYRDGKFQPCESPLVEPETALFETEWHQHMRTQGWESRGHMPQHENWEFSEYQAWFWKRCDSPVWLTELMFNDETICQIVSINAVEFILLQRDVLTPLMSYGGRDIVLGAVIEASHCLFDETNGLQCAQRVKDSDARARADDVAQRKRLEQKRLEQKRLKGVKG